MCRLTSHGSPNLEGHLKYIFGSTAPLCSSVSGREVRVEPLVYLHHLLGREAAGGGEFRHRFEVAVLSTRQAPVEHARRRVADIPEAVHYVAGNEDDSSGANRRGLAADRQLIGTLDDEEHFLLAEMDVIGRAFAGFVPRHDDRDGSASRLGAEEYLHLVAEGLERLRLFRLNDDGSSWWGFCIHVISPVFLKEPAKRFEADQQAAGHLVGSRRPDHMLIHCQNVAQAAIEWSLRSAIEDRLVQR